MPESVSRLWMVILAMALSALAQNSGSRTLAEKKPFNPRNLDGVWLGENRQGNNPFANPVPEPPLTEWGKQHLLYKSISHDSLEGTLADPNKAPQPGVVYDGQRRFFTTDQNGVTVNDPTGEYPAKDCEPRSTPAMYDYPVLGAIELVTKGERIFQLVEYFRGWRTWWLNREHPKDVEPSYEGHSIAKWEGDTLVVDTVGYNGKTMISGSVGHRKSDAFRLVERFRRVDHDHLELEMTYYDPKAWGDKAWTGFHKYYKLIPKEEFQEYICSPVDFKSYDKEVTDRWDESLKPGE